MENLPQNVIITFANQKGGTGKSTLCALLAHYLTLMGLQVFVVDADRQQTLSQLRRLNVKGQTSVENSPHATVPAGRKPDKRYINLLEGKLWEVEPLVIRDAQQTEQYMAQLRQRQGVILVDSPGSLTENGIIPLLLLSDFICCPFVYEMGTLLSTAQFLVFVEKLRNRYPDFMKTKVNLIPNKFKATVGTTQEKQRIQKTIVTLGKYSKVAPDIRDVGRIQQYTTTSFNLIQKQACEDAFGFILRENGLDRLFALWNANDNKTDD